MRKRLTRVALFLAAAVIGGMAAWWIMPHWNDMRALSRIASDDPMQRDRGWHWLSSARPDDPTPRAERVIERINTALTDAGDDAVLDASDVLRPMNLWSWRRQPVDLALREIMLRAESHTGDQQLAAVELHECPLDAPVEAVIEATQRLVMSDDPDVRMLATRALLMWLGIERIELLRQITVPEDDSILERLRRLALSWGRVPVDHWPHEPARAEPAGESVDVFEATLLQAARATPDDAERVIEFMRRWESEPKPVFAYILRHSDDPSAERELQRLADHGMDAARFALHARDAERDAIRARAIAEDSREPMWRRRLAAWRMSEIDTALRNELLTAPIADADGSVYAVTLLAERHADRDALVERAETWMFDLENDRKRAGVLLAALIGAHGELLEKLATLPDDARVRTTARMATLAVNNDALRGELLELGHRALRKPDGDFDADMLLAMLAAGNEEMLGVLVERPRGDWRMAIQQRAMLIERFVPHWHEAAGRPISGDARTIILHFDWLNARHLLDSRRIAFDATRRVYNVADGEGHSSIAESREPIARLGCATHDRTSIPRAKPATRHHRGCFSMLRTNTTCPCCRFHGSWSI